MSPDQLWYQKNRERLLVKAAARYQRLRPVLLAKRKARYHRAKELACPGCVGCGETQPGISCGLCGGTGEGGLSHA